MLSLDGDEHRRHRDPFARPSSAPRHGAGSPRRSTTRLAGWSGHWRPTGRAEIRRDLAGPLAVNVVAGALDLLDAEPAVVLGWYDEIVAAVDRVSAGGEIGPAPVRP